MTKEINIPRDVLYQKYYTERKNLYEVAKELETFPSTIFSYLKKYGIPRRNGSEAHKLSNKPMGFAKMKEENPKKFKEIFKGIIEKRNKNKEEWINNISKTKKEKNRKLLEENPDEYHKKFSTLGKLAHKLQKERDPEGYKQHQRNAGIQGFKGSEKYREEHSEEIIERNRKNGLKIKGLHPTQYSLMGLRGTTTIRKLKNYIWEGVHFDSKDELEVAKLLLEKPIEGFNTQFVVNYLTIDFFPKQKFFIEYHPFNSKGTDRTGKMTLEKYYDWRRERINETEYKNIPLYIISESYGTKKFLEQIKEIKKIIE